MNDLIIEHWSSVPVPSFAQHNVRGVKITHIPSGVTATCESERSPHANRAIALRELQEKLKEFSATAESTGLKLVPAEPTSAMCEAGSSVPLKNNQPEEEWIGDIYRAMIAAYRTQDDEIPMHPCIMQLDKMGDV